MKLRHAIPAGVVDTGSAAVATFAVGVFAVRTLAPDSLGVYAVFFAALIVANQAPGLLLLQPVEVHAVGLPLRARLGVVATSLRLASLAPLTAVLVAAVVSSSVGSLTSRGDVLAYAVTFVLAASIAPAQEHLRRMLHVANRSWDAALASIVQIPAVVGSLTILSISDVPDPWIPFGALAAGHLSALAVGYSLIRRRVTTRVAEALPLRPLLSTGRWLLAGGLGPPIGAVIVGILVGRLASPASVGFSEAARIVGRPLLVFATGLFAVMGPRFMAAGVSGDRTSARRDGVLMAMALSAAALLYAAVIQVGPSSAALEGWLPKAYEIGWLILVVLVANLALALGWAWRFELIGRGRESHVGLIDIAASASMVVVGLAAPTLESFAIPLALLSYSTWVLIGYRYLLGSERKRSESSDSPVVRVAGPDDPVAPRKPEPLEAR